MEMKFNCGDEVLLRFLGGSIGIFKISASGEDTFVINGEIFNCDDGYEIHGNGCYCKILTESIKTAYRLEKKYDFIASLMKRDVSVEDLEKLELIICDYQARSILDP